jgi:hypothetical protein
VLSATFNVSSEVKTYNIGTDSTLPSVTKKRKFENDTDEEDVKPNNISFIFVVVSFIGGGNRENHRPVISH